MRYIKYSSCLCKVGVAVFGLQILLNPLSVVYLIYGYDALTNRLSRHNCCCRWLNVVYQINIIWILRLAPALTLSCSIFWLYLLERIREIAVVEEIETSTPTIYGSTDEGDALHQTNNGVYQSPSISDAEFSKWELNYREAALYLKVDFFCVIIIVWKCITIVVVVIIISWWSLSFSHFF